MQKAQAARHLAEQLVQQGYSPEEATKIAQERLAGGGRIFAPMPNVGSEVPMPDYYKQPPVRPYMPFDPPPPTPQLSPQMAAVYKQKAQAILESGGDPREAQKLLQMADAILKKAAGLDSAGNPIGQPGMGGPNPVVQPSGPTGPYSDWAKGGGVGPLTPNKPLVGQPVTPTYGTLPPPTTVNVGDLPPPQPGTGQPGWTPSHGRDYGPRPTTGPIPAPNSGPGTYGNDHVQGKIGAIGANLGMQNTVGSIGNNMAQANMQNTIGSIGANLPPGGMKSTIGAIGANLPPTTRSNQPAPQGWDAYSKANYRPGVNVGQLRNDFMKTQQPQGGFSQGGQVRRYAEGGSPQMAPGQALKNISMGLRPSTYYSMAPSYRDFLGGVVSSLGMPEADFFSQQERQFPQGVNPNQNIAPGFRGGGKVKVKRNADGSFEYSEG
jgi:hypothetical protein